MASMAVLVNTWTWKPIAAILSLRSKHCLKRIGRAVPQFEHWVPAGMTDRQSKSQSPLPVPSGGQQPAEAKKMHKIWKSIGWLKTHKSTTSGNNPTNTENQENYDHWIHGSLTSKTSGIQGGKSSTSPWPLQHTVLWKLTDLQEIKRLKSIQTHFGNNPKHHD